jgi:kynurenine formamidase
MNINCSRSIYGSGVDTASVDFGQSRDFKTHRIFGAKNIWGLENLNNVEKLPPKGFQLFNMAYKGREGSGGPSRVIAILDDGKSNSSVSLNPSTTSGVIILFFINLLYSYIK